MLCRCWRHCGAVILTITSICRYATGYTSDVSCRSFEALSDLLPDPQAVGVPAHPESYAKLKEFVQKATEQGRIPDFLLKARKPAAEAGSMPAVCEARAGLLRSRNSPKDYSGRRLQSAPPVFQSAKMDYLETVSHTFSSDFVYRRGAVVQKFAGMGVAAGLQGSVLAGGNPNRTFISSPTGITIDHDTGNLYVADTNQGLVQKLTKKHGYNVIALFNGSWQNVSEAERIVEMSCLSPSALAFDQDTGDLYVSDEDNSRIFRVKTKAADGSDLTAALQSEDTVAVVYNSDGYRGMSGDCGAASLAKLRKPRDLTIIPAHRGIGRSLAIADSGNNRIRTMEITDWPFCIDKTGYDCTSVPEVIDTATGAACKTGADCGFTVDSPDTCAYRCRHFSSGKYPIKFPEVDHTFTATDVQNLLLGCATSASSSYLLDCVGDLSGLSGVDRRTWYFNWAMPDYLKYYTLRVAFTLTSGTVIPAGNRLMGVLVSAPS